MADADEDVIPRSGPMGEDTDLSDETQDFRFLAALSAEDAKLPKRGEKDFEPHATALQSNTLAASRLAMHTALSYQRIHQPKGHTVATYHPATNMAYAYNPRGPLFSKMGQVLSARDDPFGDDGKRGQRLWLLPEEVLYLIERGTLDVRWPSLEEDEGEFGLPMSLQGAYAMFLGEEETHDGALTFERYSVYTGLKRAGYTVLRAPTWNSPGLPPKENCYPPLLRRTWQTGLLDVSSFWKRLFATEGSGHASHDKPIIVPGLYRNYAEIYRRLALIDFHDPTAQRQPPVPENFTNDPDFRVTYHVWKPGSMTFKKSAPGTPDFRIAVVDARKTRVPSLEQLGDLLEASPYDPPREGAPFSQKLKNGYKNVILAVVDQGVTSYLRIADSAFGRERLYQRTFRGSGKRGGRGGGRGGRGRGR
ncbi:putative tRNA-splicing endonuclease subunit sen54 [Acrodontium crateriforme]|uniref:tRNA-splicing endonuclease subunit sen54 n=1 Tax=Acrodontium crateriforme TaxID=150365 RepID=A0AAQ3MBF0_9PEZI|nr:putative tRNA-splicing endonuclease subunit sen54 [Acrodontium crateriforme]